MRPYRTIFNPNAVNLLYLQGNARWILDAVVSCNQEMWYIGKADGPLTLT